MASPTSRTLEALRKEGWIAQVVEKYNHWSRQKTDLFGGIDIIAIKGESTLGVQATVGSSHAAHVSKLLSLDTMKLWLCGPRMLELWSWSRYKVKRGGKAVRWKVRVATFVLDQRGRVCVQEFEPIYPLR